MPTLTRLYTMQEAALHNTREDCWVVVDGKVYNVTNYLDEHPGGDDVLIAATGKDATDEFEDAGHSKSAREIMEEYCIGELDPSAPAIPELEIYSKNQSTDPLKKMMEVTTQYWVVPIAIVSISVVAGFLYLRTK
ncbi:cytochrome b5 [Macadamia integrifolia]|uniref:cytochrome b5 n=1 Tax=Macadamia integrifolia TaxID=60698 RepID=UPI001C4ECD8D|nr:cytochrome b5 [Macadamia integrifolia]